MKHHSRATQGLLADAMASLRQGQYKAAEASLRLLLKREPRHAAACHLTGLTMERLGRPQEAVQFLRRAITIDPRNAAMLLDLAQCLMALGQDEEALESLQRALALEPGPAQAHFDCGVILLKLDRPEEAIAAFERAIVLQPDFAAGHNQLGYALIKARNPVAALAAFQNALGQEPDNDIYLLNTGSALCRLRRHEEALPLVDRVLLREPGNDAALLLRAEALLGVGQAEQALKIAESLLAKDPKNLKAHAHRITALMVLGRQEEALAIAEATCAQFPDEALAEFSCAYVHHQLNQLEEAVASYGKVMALDPNDDEAAFARAMALLALGRFEEGWAAYEVRTRKPEIFLRRQFRQPAWQGQVDLKDKRLFVYQEQGLGDTIQFSRYVRLAAAAGANVAFSVQDPLLRLMRASLAGVTVISRGEAPTDFDLHCALLSMPLGFGTRLDTIPSSSSGYLKAPAAETALWRQRLAPKSRCIGLVWSGNPGHKNDTKRSIPLAQLQDLFQQRHHWISLQKEVRESDRLALESFGLFDPSEELNDFADTAALITALDLVITVDTSVAHLAGALGKACWVMLPFVPDFRWLLDREDSPWYPGMRLFRQQSPGDWEGVVARIRAALHS